MKFKYLLFFFSILNLSFSSAIAEVDPNRLAVHLLSYLAQDYGEAVKDGEVISQDEYTEQIEFINEVLEISRKNNYPDRLNAQIEKLSTSIEDKDSVPLVSSLATSIKLEIISEFGVVTRPSREPDLTRAKNLYRQSCVQCHGALGKGDGVAGGNLNPKPTNFLDLERMRGISPFQAYNTISIGVPGTGMTSYSFLSDHDRWSLAFYISSLRYVEIEGDYSKQKISLEDRSTLTDIELLEKYEVPKENELNFLSSIRSFKGGGVGKRERATQYIEFAKTNLEESLKLFKAGKHTEANNRALKAYLEGVEPVEGFLKARDARLVSSLEKKMIDYRNLIKNSTSSESVTKEKFSKIMEQLDIANGLIGGENSAIGTFFLSFGIVLREALEAGLVLLLLFGVLNRFESRRLKRVVHFGWISSIFSGVLLYFLFEMFFTISGRTVESLEAYVGVFAALILLYVGVWFHRHSNIEKWKKTLEGSVSKHIVNGKSITLFAISFAAVFREIFETLLFMKILTFDGHSKSVIGVGALAALLLSTVLIYLAIRFSLRLKLGILFNASTFLILFLSATILGKSIGAFQLTGTITATNLEMPSIELIGFNGTLEVLVSQVGILLLSAIYFALSKLLAQRQTVLD